MSLLTSPEGAQTIEQKDFTRVDGDTQAVTDRIYRARQRGDKWTAMKIVFELHGTPQTHVSVDAYSTCRQDQPSRWCGSRCELLIVDCLDWSDEQNRREGDVIHIEGDTASVRAALTDALSSLDINEQVNREWVEKKLAGEQQCQTCGYWVHPREEWHADGHGNRCGTPESAVALAEKGRIRRRIEEPPAADAVDPVAADHPTGPRA